MFHNKSDISPIPAFGSPFTLGVSRSADMLSFWIAEFGALDHDLVFRSQKVLHRLRYYEEILIGWDLEEDPRDRINIS